MSEKMNRTADSFSGISEKIENNDTRIHDIGVQVYRNVQAVVEKEVRENRDKIDVANSDLYDIKTSLMDISQKLESVSQKLDAAADAPKEDPVGSVRVVSIITLIVAAATLVVNILSTLGII